MADEKQPKQPRWWIPITFGILLTWLVNNLITILAFVGTGVVNLSHVGVGPFLLALGLSLVCGAIGTVLGIRLTIAATGMVIMVLWLGLQELRSAVFGSDAAPVKPSFGSVPATVAQLSRVPTDNRLRSRARYATGRFLMWVFVPKHIRRMFVFR